MFFLFLPFYPTANPPPTNPLPNHFYGKKTNNDRLDISWQNHILTSAVNALFEYRVKAFKLLKCSFSFPPFLFRDFMFIKSQLLMVTI